MKIVLDSQGGNEIPSLARNGAARVLEVYSLEEEKHPLQLPSEVIQKRIIGIRGIPVMLDRDLAELYGVPVKRLNEQVGRNIERFPEPFMFQLTATEVADLKSQIATSNEGDSMVHLKSQFATSSWGGVRKPPKVFSEQGVAMLSAVLNSKTAVTVSIAIMDAFVKMRRFQLSNSEMLCRINVLEKRQFTTEAKVDEVLNRLNQNETPMQGVFYEGQLWDACSFVEKLISKAKVSILLIDSWVGVGTLDMLAKKRKGVAVTLVTSPRGNKLAATDIAKFAAQYGVLDVKTSTAFHDRFLILDDKELYLIMRRRKRSFRRAASSEARTRRAHKRPRASLKDLGKKCFGFTKMDAGEIAGIRARV